MRRLLLAVYVLLLLTPVIRAQRHPDALSEAEIEQVRDTNRLPNDRVLVFVKFLDARTDKIHDLTTKPRRPGREQDIHDMMEQFVSVADTLEDNLNEYGPRHRDVRKALPKLLRAIDRWSSTLKSPPDDEAYNVSRKLSLEALRDLREDTEHLIEDQKTWFAAHPPQKDAEGNQLPNNPSTALRAQLGIRLPIHRSVIAAGGTASRFFCHSRRESAFAVRFSGSLGVRDLSL